MPVSRRVGAPLWRASGGGARWIGRRGASADTGGPPSCTAPSTSRQTAEHGVSHGHGDRAAEGARLGAARDAVGRLHRHRADGALVEIGLHLGDAAHGAEDLDRVVDPRRLAFLEPDVEHGPAHGDDHAPRLGRSGAAICDRGCLHRLAR